MIYRKAFRRGKCTVRVPASGLYSANALWMKNSCNLTLNNAQRPATAAAPFPSALNRVPRNTSPCTCLKWYLFYHVTADRWFHIQRSELAETRYMSLTVVQSVRAFG